MTTNVIENAQMSQEEKNDIIVCIREAVQHLGSARAVAIRCGVSDATISQMVSGQYSTKGDEMWRRVANGLGWKSGRWNIAIDTTNFKAVTGVLQDAQSESLFIPISEKAGAGKTSSIEHFLKTKKNVFRIICRDWSKREFLNRLCQTLGINPGNGYKSLDNLLQLIIDFFLLRKGKPLLIIDQANSLKPSVLSYLIYLFNDCEDRLGVVLSGTEHLRVDVKRGVKYSRKGYDEIDSRFGRKYITLLGNTLSDTRKICIANGITDRNVQEEIFERCEPYTKSVQTDNGPRDVKVVEDGRLIKRAIQRHLMMNALNN